MATKKTNTPEAATPKKAAQPTPVSPVVIPEQPATQAVQSGSTPPPDSASTPIPGAAGEPATTGDPEGGTPSPEYRGQTTKQIAQKQAAAAVTPPSESKKTTETKTPPEPEPKKTAGDKTPPKSKQADSYEVLAAEYAKHYPDNPTFHITRDKQVFLAGDRNLAVLHQSTLQTEEKVHSINVKR